VNAVANPPRGLRAWLLSDSPTSTNQARCQRFYVAWLSFRRNPIAMLGLFIIAGLVLMAALVPLVTGSTGMEPERDRRKTRGPEPALKCPKPGDPRQDRTLDRTQSRLGRS